MPTPDRWTAGHIPDQSGRTVVVTGANSGLGLVTAEQLAARGARVIMAVRDEDRGRRAADTITARHPGVAVQVRRLDLADLPSVRAFADAVRTDVTGLDVLVNNGGLMFPPRRLSPQGHEIQFATNHLGHFALTGLLLELLRKRPRARVVTVTSLLHRRGRIRFDDLTGARHYSPREFYAQSKLANVLFGLELDRRLRAAGESVRSLLAHPGYAATNLQVSGPTGAMKVFGRIGNRLVAQDAATGALPQLYAATDPAAEGGQLIGPGGPFELRGHPRVVRPARPAGDRELAGRLWQVSEELTGVRYGLPEAGPPAARPE